MDLAVEGARNHWPRKRVVNSVAETLALDRDVADALVDATVVSWPVSVRWYPPSAARDRQIHASIASLLAVSDLAPDHVALAQEVTGGLYGLAKHNGRDRAVLWDYVLGHPAAYALASYVSDRKLVDRIVIEHPDRIGIQALRLSRRLGALGLEQPFGTSRLELSSLARRLALLLESDEATSGLTLEVRDRVRIWTAQLAFDSLFEVGLPAEALAAIDALPAPTRRRAVLGPHEALVIMVDGEEFWLRTIDLRLEVAMAMALVGRAEEAKTLAATMSEMLCRVEADQDLQGNGRDLPFLMSLVDALTGRPPADLWALGLRNPYLPATPLLALARIAALEDMDSMRSFFLREAVHEMVLHRRPEALENRGFHDVATRGETERLMRTHAAAVIDVEDAIMEITPPSSHALGALERLVELTRDTDAAAAADGIDALHPYGPSAARAFESYTLDSDIDGIVDARDQMPLTPRLSTGDTDACPIAFALNRQIGRRSLDHFGWSKRRPLIVVAEDRGWLGLVRTQRRALILDPTTAILLRRQVPGLLVDLYVNHSFDRDARRSLVHARNPHLLGPSSHLDRLVMPFYLALDEGGSWQTIPRSEAAYASRFSPCADQPAESNAE